MTDRRTWPVAGGEMGERVRAHDWSQTPLGPIEGWPQSLRTAVDVCLGCGFASVVWWGPELIQVYNDAAIAIHGARHPDALGRPARDAWSKIWPAIAPGVEQVLRTGEAVVGEDLPLPGADARLSFSYSALRDERGEVAGLLAVAAPEPGERRLREPAGAAGPPVDFRALFEASPTPLLVVAAADFSCVAVNDAYLRAAGTTREELIGRPLLEVFPAHQPDPDSAGTQGLRDSLERVLATGHSDVMQIQRYDPFGRQAAEGEPGPRWWSLIHSPLREPGGKIVAILHRLEDVTDVVRLRREASEPDQLARDQLDTLRRLREATADLARTEAALLESERKRAEAALRESEGRFRMIANLVPDLLWSSDANGAATWYNQRWTEYTGLSLGQSIGDGWLAAVHPDDQPGIYQTFQAALATESPLRHELRLRGADRQYRWFLLEARPARDDAGRVAQWFGALADIHEQRLALRAAERASEAKSQFLAVMSHELRTPLSGVLSFSDLMEAEIYGPITAQQQEALARIKANSRHLVSIIDEVLTLSRAEAGRVEVKLEEVDATELAREVVQILEPEAEQRGLALHLEAPDAVPPLRTDVGKVRQILLNLVGNAVKYTERGEVWVRVDSGSADGLQIHVRDTGPGIAAEDQERIFEPFTQVDASHTRTAGGTGLGLAIARRLARILGGDVGLRSAPGQGSTFTLRLPRRPAEEA